MLKIYCGAISDSFKHIFQQAFNTENINLSEKYNASPSQEGSD